MTTTDILAWVGALTGILSFFWNIFTWARSGPNIKVSASGNMTFPNRGNDGHFVTVEACNTGNNATTITHLIGLYYCSWWKRITRRPPDKNFAVIDPYPGRLPHFLESGQRWLGAIEQTEDLMLMSQEGRLYCGIYHSSSPKKPVLVRVVIPPRKTSAHKQ